MSGTMDISGLTDIGLRRYANEDQFFIGEVNKSIQVHQTSLGMAHRSRLFGNSHGKLILVADGMGGHEAGERASQLVIDAFVDFVLNRLSSFMIDGAGAESDFQEQLRDAIEACHTRILHEVESIPQQSGMGSTMTLTYIVWPKMFLMHVGDSRCYLLRDGVLNRLTSDHTLYELTRATTIAKEDEAHAVDANSANPMSNVLWNTIGGGKEHPRPDTSIMRLRTGDKLLLCTDGLTRYLTDQRLTEVLREVRPTDELCRKLVDEANKSGGRDNITVVVCNFRDGVTSANAEISLDLESDDLADTVDFEDIG